MAVALAVLAALAFGLPAGAAAQKPPDVSTAAAAIVVDGRNGEVMFAKRPDERHAIASTTKLMTALLALERARPRRRVHGARVQRAARRVAHQPARAASA